MDSTLSFTTQRRLTIKTAQRKAYEFVNETSNAVPFEREYEVKRSFKKTNTLERLRDETKTDKFKIASEVNFEYASTKGQIQASADFENQVREYMKSTAETTVEAVVLSKQVIKASLAPKERITIYTNTTSGEGYTYEWESNTAMEAAESAVTITVKTDLNPVFNALLDTVANNATGISTDAGEWAKYGEICTDARVKGGIRKYITRVKNELWTNGLDRSSWRAVKTAAEQAEGALNEGNNIQALEYILLGFNNVRRPSHNGWAWDNCRNIGRRYLGN